MINTKQRVLYLTDQQIVDVLVALDHVMQDMDLSGQKGEAAKLERLAKVIHRQTGIGSPP